MSLDELQTEIDRSAGNTAKFPNVGDSVAGTIVDGYQSQQTDYNTGEPKFWKDGNPMMQQVIVLDTGEEEPTKLYAKGQMWQAIRDAVRQSGGSIAKGGKLGVRFDREEPSERGNPKKIYVAQYAPPSSFDAVAEAASEPEKASEPIF